MSSQRCPGCDQPPRMVIGDRQAFCGNDDCQVFAWDLEGDPAKFKAKAQVVDLTPMLVLEPSITCPRCGSVSYHPDDIDQHYCGRCHWWTSDPTLGSIVLPPVTGEVVRPGPPFIDRDQCPNGLVIHIYAVPTAELLAVSNVHSGMDLEAVANRDRVAASDQWQGDVCLVIFDGDTGKRFFTDLGVPS